MVGFAGSTYEDKIFTMYLWASIFFIKIAKKEEGLYADT
jgi:hypothetical protein